MAKEKGKKFNLLTFFLTTGLLILAAVAAFVLSVVFKTLLLNVSQGLKTKFYLHESIALSEYEEKYVSGKDNALIWEIDDEGIVEIVEENGVKNLKAVGVGNTSVRVLRDINISQEKSLVDTLEISVSFFDEIVDAAVRSELGKKSDEKIYFDEITSLSSLNLSGKTLLSYKDFKFFSNLKNLDLSGSSVSALGKSEGALDLAYFSLDYLNLSECRSLTDISALYDMNTKVKEVNLSGSAIREARVPNLSSSVKKLNISRSGVAGLTLSGGALKEIIADELILTSQLKLADMSAIESVSLKKTQVPALTVSGNLNALKSINLASANITGNASVYAQLPALTSFDMSGMTVKGGLDVGGTFNELNSFDLGKAKITGNFNLTANLQKAVSINIGGVNAGGKINLLPVAPLLKSYVYGNITASNDFTIGGTCGSLEKVDFSGLKASGNFVLSGSFNAVKSVTLDNMNAQSIKIDAAMPYVTDMSLGKVVCTKGVKLAASYSKLASFSVAGAKIDGAIEFGNSNLNLETLDVSTVNAGELNINAPLGLKQITATGAKMGALKIGANASISAITSLSFANCGLNSVSLNYAAFTDIYSIDFSNNALTAFALPAEGIPSLKTLNLANNSISNLDAGKSTRLESVNASGNKITKFILSGTFEKLQSINLNENELTEFQLSGSYPLLGVLNLSGNSEVSVNLNGTFPQISTISKTMSTNLKALTLGGSFNALDTISLAGAGLTKFKIAPTTQLPKLGSLLLGENVLDELELAGDYPSLEAIKINGLSATVGGITFSGDFPVLKQISADNARVRGTVNLSGTFGVELDVTAGNLQGASGSAASLSITRIEKLKTLSLVNANLAQLRLDTLSGLTMLDMSASTVNTFTAANLSGLSSLNFSNAFIGTLNFSKSFANLTNANFINANINTAVFNGVFEKLVSLNLSSAGINSISFEKDNDFAALTELNLNGNKISRLTFGISMPALKTLNLANNSFRELTLDESFPALQSLSVAGNGSATAKMNFTLGGNMPLLENVNIAGCNFARFAINGQFSLLEEISLTDVAFNDFYFGEASRPQNNFTVKFNSLASYVYGNLPMPVPFALSAAFSADELADKAAKAIGSTIVHAMFDDDFRGSAVYVSADALRFGIYGTGNFENFYIKSAGGSLSEMYFYDLNLSAGSNNVIDATNSTGAKLYFYGSCILSRSGSSSSPAATLAGNTLEIINYNSLTVYGQDGTDANSYSGNGAAGGSAISGADISFNGAGTVFVRGGNGGDGMYGKNASTSDLNAGTWGSEGGDGGAGGAGGIAVDAAESIVILSGSLELYGGRGGNGTRGGSGSGGNDGAYGSNGRGGNGGQGGDGGRGGNGGQGGSAIRCKQGSVERSAVVNLFGGAGGNGGNGGDGGRGGNGGNGRNGVFLGATGTDGGDGGYGGNGGGYGTGGTGGNAVSGNFVTVTQSVKGKGGQNGSYGSANFGGSGGLGGTKVMGGRHNSGTDRSGTRGH